MIRGKKTVALTLAILLFNVSNVAFANVKEGKLAGADRYKTAVEISKDGWSKSNKAIIVGGTATADALCVSPIADEYDAPILLTEKNKVNDDTLKELKRLGVNEVLIVDSDNLISKSQEDVLKSQGYKVDRIGGTSIVDTSLKLANKLKVLYQAKGTPTRKSVFVVNGYKGLADATSVSSVAGMKDSIILYTNGSNLKGVKEFIQASTDDVYLIGGNASISTQIENDLKTTTNKQIIRIAGEDRKDTNAKVINTFYTEKDMNNMYIAKDGMGNEGDLVDGLAVGSLASKNKAPVVLASKGLGKAQESMIKTKTVKAVTQVGEGGNETAVKQAVGIINAVAQPEPSDGMKLPTINFAKEQNVAVTGRGGARGYASATSAKGNVIQGTIYAKYGDPTRGMHTYGSVNQKEYDMVLQFVKDNLKTINFRLQSDWVYLQHHLNGVRDKNFIDPILQKNGINISYGDWEWDNKYVIAGLQKGIVSRADAENLAMYTSAVGHIRHKIGDTTDPGDGTPFSAYGHIFNKISDCDASSELDLICSDLVGLNGAVAGSEGHLNILIQVGNYYWIDGRTPSLKKGDNIFYKHEMVFEAPTYNLGY